jgi:hypothetical protein
MNTLLETDTYSSRRTRMDLSLLQFMLLRGEDWRRAEPSSLIAVVHLNQDKVGLSVYIGFGPLNPLFSFFQFCLDLFLYNLKAPY